MEAWANVTTPTGPAGEDEVRRRQKDSEGAREEANGPYTKLMDDICIDVCGDEATECRGQVMSDIGRWSTPIMSGGLQRWVAVLCAGVWRERHGTPMPWVSGRGWRTCATSQVFVMLLNL